MDYIDTGLSAKVGKEACASQTDSEAERLITNTRLVEKLRIDEYSQDLEEAADKYLNLGFMHSAQGIENVDLSAVTLSPRFGNLEERGGQRQNQTDR